MTVHRGHSKQSTKCGMNKNESGDSWSQGFRDALKRLCRSDKFYDSKGRKSYGKGRPQKFFSDSQSSAITS